MADAHSLVRVLDELLFTLRRAGFAISVAQALDVVRAVRAVGLEDRHSVRVAVAAVVVHRSCDRVRFDAHFGAFFDSASSGARDSLWTRLATRGFAASDLDVLRDILARLRTSPDDLGAFLDGGAELDSRLARFGAPSRMGADNPRQLGYRTHLVLREVGETNALLALGAIRTALVDALGARGMALAAALSDEVLRSQEVVRAFVRGAFEEAAAAENDRIGQTPETTPFAALSDDGIEEVRRAVRRFAARLRGCAAVRAKRGQKGDMAPHRMLRRAMRTGGVPIELLRRRKHLRRPRLFVLCDVSDSVRAAASFLLEFTYAAQDLFEGARSFVFVSGIEEVTAHFARNPPAVAIAHAWHGRGAGQATDNSNYGRALRMFEANYIRDIDRRTTVVILGDGRTNFREAAPEVVGRIRGRARAVLWLCPESRSQWAEGDSAMPRYAPECSAVYEVRSAADLERAASAILARQSLRSR